MVILLDPDVDDISLHWKEHSDYYALVLKAHGIKAERINIKGAKWRKEFAEKGPFTGYILIAHTGLLPGGEPVDVGGLTRDDFIRLFGGAELLLLDACKSKEFLDKDNTRDQVVDPGGSIVIDSIPSPVDGSTVTKLSEKLDEALTKHGKNPQKAVHHTYKGDGKWDSNERKPKNKR